MRATSYSRVSFDDLRERRSVGEQEGENQEAIAREGWTLVASFVDNDRSASRFATKSRPGFDELVQHIDSGGCDVLVLWESSRGSRTMTQWSSFVDLCRDRHVLVHVVTHRRTYDPQVARDWRTLVEEGVTNAYASEETRERVIRALTSNATRGRPHGKIIYGYVREYDSRGRFIGQLIREDQAAVIRDVAERVIAGETTSRIVADLNRRGVPTPGREALLRRVEEIEGSDVDGAAQLAEQVREQAGSLQWDLTGLRQLITNPAYAALRVHRGGVVGAGDWPAILDADTHRRVVAIMTDPKRKTVRDGSVRHLLTNVARCGECGSPLIAQRARKRYAYLCGGSFCISINALWLEPFIESAIIGRLGQPDAAEFFMPKVDWAAIDRAAAEVVALRAELDAAIESVGRPGGLTVATLARLEQSLTARIEDAERRASPPDVPAAVSAVAELAGPGVEGRWKRYGVARRRTVVRQVVDVRVRRGRKGARTFDPKRLGASRWVGDPLTWEERGLV